MATRTTTTRATRAASAPSADSNTGHAGPSFHDLAQAYFDCRRAKRSSESALRFEIDLEHNLATLYDELREDAYTPGRSICFVVTHPKPREVWAADFRDRIVHHLLYNHVAPAIHARFIADSCACIPGRGTLYGARRLEAMIRSQTQNWSRPGFYLKCDIANFFVSISKTRNSTGRRVIYEWTPELRTEINRAISVRPALSPFLFCNRDGESYVREDGTAPGWNNIWQNFMEKLLKESKVNERFTEHDMRAKVGSDAEDLERARQLLGHADARLTERVYRRKPERIKPTK